MVRSRSLRRESSSPSRRVRTWGTNFEGFLLVDERAFDSIQFLSCASPSFVEGLDPEGFGHVSDGFWQEEPQRRFPRPFLFDLDGFRFIDTFLPVLARAVFLALTREGRTACDEPLFRG